MLGQVATGTRNAREIFRCEKCTTLRGTGKQLMCSFALALHAYLSNTVLRKPTTPFHFLPKALAFGLASFPA